jgi:Ni/Fe-hydrogenase subunit HybB-like protein
MILTGCDIKITKVLSCFLQIRPDIGNTALQIHNFQYPRFGSMTRYNINKLSIKLLFNNLYYVFLKVLRFLLV